MPPVRIESTTCGLGILFSSSEALSSDPAALSFPDYKPNSITGARWCPVSDVHILFSIWELYICALVKVFLDKQPDGGGA